MTTTEISGSPKTAPVKTAWLRRTVMGTAFATAGILTLGAAATPAQAWYGYGPHPYYAYYYPHHYGWYGAYPAYHVGWGWGWRGGWSHGGWGYHHW